MKTTRPDTNTDAQFMRKVQEEIQIETKEQQETATQLAKSTTGSFTNMPMNSPYFRKWLEERREKNFLIGKHVTDAPEYNTPTRNFGETVLSSEDPDAKEYLELLTSEVKEYDKSEKEVFGLKIFEDGESNKTSNKNFDEKFLDIVIVENVTRQLPATTSVEEVIQKAKEEMCDFHEDENYSSELDFTKIIEDTRVIMIANQQERNKKVGLIAKFAKDQNF